MKPKLEGRRTATETKKQRSMKNKNDLPFFELLLIFLLAAFFVWFSNLVADINPSFLFYFPLLFLDKLALINADYEEEEKMEINGGLSLSFPFNSFCWSFYNSLLKVGLVLQKSIFFGYVCNFVGLLVCSLGWQKKNCHKREVERERYIRLLFQFWQLYLRIE